jgi:hypothetical protein
MKTAIGIIAGVSLIAIAGYKLKDDDAPPRIQVTPSTYGTIQTFNGVTGILT